MNPFFNVWVLGQPHWRHMAQMFLVADRVTVWGASFQQIVDANINYGFPYTPTQFLTLIDEGFIRYAARETWYNASKRSESTNTNFVMSEWEDSFDLELKKRLATNRVVALPQYDVQDWISDQFQQNSLILRNVFNYSKRLPKVFKGVEERRLDKQFENSQILVERILSFSRNHHLASEALDCDTVVETADSPKFFQDIGASPHLRRTVCNEDKIQLEDLLYYMSRVRYDGLDEARNFSKHLDRLHALRDYGLTNSIAQKSFKYIDIENDILRSLLRKITLEDEKWSQLDNAALLAPGLALAVKEVVDQVQSRSVSRRGILGLGMLTAAVTDLAVKSGDVIETVLDEPKVDLNDVERALAIVTRDSTVSSSVPISVAKELYEDVRKINVSFGA